MQEQDWQDERRQGQNQENKARNNTDKGHGMVDMYLIKVSLGPAQGASKSAKRAQSKM